MGDRSAIQWTEATWNPIAGCSRVSEGCRNCYAERQAIRIPRYQDVIVRSTSSGPRWTGNLMLHEEQLDQPLRWKRPRRIFVNSMSDLFHEQAPDEWIERIFGVMARAWWHTFQVLTKRPERMRAFLNRPWRTRVRDCAGHWPLPNVWLGVSVEDQTTADARIPLLLQTPAAVRWVSYEPALGSVDFRPWLHPRCQGCGNYRDRGDEEHSVVVPTGDEQYPEQGYPCGPVDSSLDWIVVGGESGPGARPFDLAWAGQTIAQGRAAGVPVFVKQLGASPYSMTGGYGSGFGAKLLSPTTPEEAARWYPTDPLRNRKGGDPAEWPEDLRVREYPQ